MKDSDLFDNIEKKIEGNEFIGIKLINREIT